ncbi:MAG: PKD domain-containing protein [Bacteroidota bacterium]
MRKLITFSVLLIFASIVKGQDIVKALFLGNSYTAVNTLPLLVARMANNTGDLLTWSWNTPGGYTLSGHLTSATSVSLIQQGGWDYVVLQEQSQLPSFTNPEVESLVFPYAHSLDSMIDLYNPCANTTFYMTWGRKNGDASNCAVWPPVCTYEGMDSLLRMRYRMMADTNHALLSPVGWVWHYLRHNHPSIELYNPDESHPSLAGSYVGAACFYTLFFKNDPALITWDSTLNTADALVIRNAVHDIVYDSLSKWNVGRWDPVADFTLGHNGLQIDFTDQSHYADSWTWDFGDGNFSTVQNPSHTFTAPGAFNVELKACRCGICDSVTQVITVTSAESNLFAKQFFLYPNPAKDKLILSYTGNDMAFEQFTLMDAQGKIILQKGKSEGSIDFIDVSKLPSGNYFLRVFGNKNSALLKFIKE